MKKAYWATGLAVGLLGVALSALSLNAGAAPNSSMLKSWHSNPLGSRAATVPASHEGSQTFVIRSREINNVDIDVGNEGFGPGDYSIFRERLFNTDGTPVGYDKIQCTAIFPLSQEVISFNCDGVFLFSGAGGHEKGAITVAGNINFTETSGVFNIAITGGTRHYQNVRGQLLPGKGNAVIFHLLP